MASTAPGGVAELDFGKLGAAPGRESGRRRDVWALLVTLRHSRH